MIKTYSQHHMEREIKAPLGLIDSNSTESNEEFFLNIPYEMFPDDIIGIYRKGKHLVVWANFKSLFSDNRKCDQQEFPLAALPWFIDTLENEFWNAKPDPNAVPGRVSSYTWIEGEKVGINPMRHCCAENLPGYVFWNASRNCYLSKTPPQEWEIPRYMLEQGLLDELKKISTQLGLKTY